MSKESFSLFSPAKVNLFFRVLHRREDGYHDIASLYQAISLGDTLTVSLAEKDKLTCDHSDVPCDERNLISQAIHIFRKKTGYTFGVHVHLTKKVPMQAGLGGGSSNAATTLFALNALSASSVDECILSDWASEFSSDASFFFSLGSAYCCGRGEKLTCLPALAPQSFWLAKPKEGLATPLVYKSCKPELFLQRDPEQFLKTTLEGQLVSFNDLEDPAFSLMPALSTLKRDLQQLGFSQVVMTGSGTAFMCFGSIERPVLPEIAFFPVYFINRKLGEWYEFPFI